MATFYPNLENIGRFRRQPEGGEQHLLRFLGVLKDDFEIYFQPFLNGDRPDIVIMRRNYGVIIIEVKDWTLNTTLNYMDYQNPVLQVEKYKQRMIDFHIETMYRMNRGNHDYFGIIKCVLYFHNMTTSESNNFFRHDYVDVIGSDSLDVDSFRGLLKRLRFDKQSRLFNDDLYREFHRVLSPPEHVHTEGVEILYDSTQKRLIKSKSGAQKVRGVAGSGKTTVLAHRAVNAFLRTNEPVLILTYNITLRNYIHDKISKIREDFPWDVFVIENYHSFIKQQLLRSGIILDNEHIDFLEDDVDNGYLDLIRNNVDDFDGLKFDTIIIDEVQDYEKDWVDIIKNVFLRKDGEFVVFGDEKQNIYNREIGKDKRPYTGISGEWNVLKKCYRHNTALGILCGKFQDAFLSHKYINDKTNSTLEFTFDNGSLTVPIMKYSNNYEDDTTLWDRMRVEIIDNNLHDVDTAIICENIRIAQMIDFNVRGLGGSGLYSQTDTTFESLEDAGILNEYDIVKERRLKKRNFWMQSGKLKISTIHSFKGWEVMNLFLVLSDNANGDMGIDELIYTALTRCRKNLYIFSKNNKYDNFFLQNIHGRM